MSRMNYPFGLIDMADRLRMYGDVFGPIHDGKGRGLDTMENGFMAMAASLLRKIEGGKSDLFREIVMSEGGEGSTAAAAGYYADRILGRNRDVVWFSTPHEAGTIANAPGLSISFGAPRDSDHPAVLAADVRIPSERTARPGMTRLSTEAEVRGRTVPFSKGLTVDGVNIERVGNYSALIGVGGFEIEYSGMEGVLRTARSTGDPDAFTRALDAFTATLMDELGSLAEGIEADLDGGREWEPGAAKASAELVSMIKSMNEFSRNPLMNNTWEFILARANRHYFANVITKVSCMMEMMNYSSRGKRRSDDFGAADILESAMEAFASPLDCMLGTFEHFVDARKWLALKSAGGAAPDMRMVEGRALREALSMIISEAGRPADAQAIPADMTMGWDAGRSAAVVTDRTTDRSALWAFEHNGPARGRLQSIVAGMGVGAAVGFIRGAHPVSQITIAVPPGALMMR